MQTRIAFNSGEFAPEMAYRSDMDQYGRACETLENWEVSQMGCIKRRKGMRYLTDAISEHSRLIPYIYSYAADESQRFLVELSEQVVRVLDYNGNEQARFTNGDSQQLDFWYTPHRCYYKQINNLLIITSLDNRPMVLKRNQDNEWVFEPWEFKQQMWRYNYEQRDYPITISRSGDDYSVTFDAKEEESETTADMLTSEYLRASFWTEEQEARQAGQNLREGVRIVSSVPTSAYAGLKFAIAADETVKYFVCIKDWSDKEYYTVSLDSPANYPNNFIEAENTEGFEEVTAYYSIHDVNPGGTIAKGTKIAIKMAYWEYYTCIKDYNGLTAGYDKFSDYPSRFISGLAVGEALPCRGEWSFYCSGVWFGCYEIRRNYDSPLLDEHWEQRGTSFSRYDAASNLQPTGSEADEACYMRLFITRSKKMSEATGDAAATLAAGFPADSCGIALIVKPYKHDLVLRCEPTIKDEVQESISWYCNDKVQVKWGAARNVKDWSWQAFSERYGYPLLCEVYNKRLVFASTEDQPQTIWLSRTDDLNNFATSGSSETAAMALTMNTTSQNPICWMQAQSYRLVLGTSEAEYSVSAGQSQGGISNNNAQIEDHSHVGSDGVAALALNDTALFIERGAGRVYSLQYSLQIDGYAAQDISIFAPHISSEHGGIVAMSSIRKPDTVALFVLGDGQLGLCTYNTLHEIHAWHRWVTDGRILSVCGMPDGNNNDKVFLVVKRENKTDNGIILNEGVYIEVVDDESEYADNGKDYDSVVVLNALMDYREGFFGKRASVPNYLCIGADFKIEGDNILVSDNGGEKWLRPPHRGDFVLRKGWNMQFTPSGYKYEVKPAVKVRGNQGITILGIRD